MTKAETAALLGVCAAFDQRTVGREDVEAWFSVIGDLPAADAMTAVKEHYRDSRERIMPADVRGAVKRMRRKRLEEAPPLVPPADLDPDDEFAYRRWLRAARNAVADGREPPPALPGRPRDVRAAIKGTFRDVADA